MLLADGRSVGVGCKLREGEAGASGLSRVAHAHMMRGSDVHID